MFKVAKKGGLKLLTVRFPAERRSIQVKKDKDEDDEEEAVARDKELKVERDAKPSTPQNF